MCALAKAFSSINSTNSESGWTCTGTFPNDPICQWQGLTCQDGKLIAIHLGQTGLTGTIPDEIGYLRHLQSLSLYGNHLTGTIPLTMGALTALQLLDIHNNHLEGKVPYAFCDLVALRDIHLEANPALLPPPACIQIQQNAYMAPIDASGASSPHIFNRLPIKALRSEDFNPYYFPTEMAIPPASLEPPHPGLMVITTLLGGVFVASCFILCIHYLHRSIAKSFLV